MKREYSRGRLIVGDSSGQHEPDPAPLRRRSGRLEQLESQVTQLLARMNIAVIFGGDKSVEGAVINKTQNPRSWKSYENVAQDIAESLGRLGCKSVHLIPDDMRLGERLRDRNIHLGWLNTGGVQGYDSMLHGAALLEMVGVPYVGHNPLTAGILDNKATFKRQLNAIGVPTARFMTWHLSQDSFSPADNARFTQTFDGYSGPFVVKPVCGRASQHISVIDDLNDLPRAVEAVYHQTENHVLIEEFLPGREFTVAVSGRITARGRRLMRTERPFVFSVVERVLTEDERIFTSMDVAPITQDRLRLLGPDSDNDTYAEIVNIACAVAEELDIDALIRLDLRKGANGEVNVLEVNPKPDVKKPTDQMTSIVCFGLESVGMDYDDLILSMFADRIDRLFCERRHIMTSFSALLD